VVVFFFFREDRYAIEKNQYFAPCQALAAGGVLTDAPGNISFNLYLSLSVSISRFYGHKRKKKSPSRLAKPLLLAAPMPLVIYLSIYIFY